QNLFAVSNQDYEDANPNQIIFWKYSMDGGATWQPTKPLGGFDRGALPPAQLDPGAVFDKFGNLFVSYEVSPHGFDIAIGWSQDGGRTFTPLHTVTDNAGTDFPNLAVGPAGDGDGQIIWMSYAAGPALRVVHARVMGSGNVGAFSEPTSVPLPNGV